MFGPAVGPYVAGLAAGLVPIVRPSGKDPHLLTRPLDNGAMGLLMALLVVTFVFMLIGFYTLQRMATELAGIYHFDYRIAFERAPQVALRGRGVGRLELRHLQQLAHLRPSMHIQCRACPEGERFAEAAGLNPRGRDLLRDDAEDCAAPSRVPAMSISRRSRETHRTCPLPPAVSTWCGATSRCSG